MDVLPGPSGPAVHTAWGPAFAYDGHRHTHHLRELALLVEQAWARELVNFLLDNKPAVIWAGTPTDRRESEELARLAKRCTGVLAHGPPSPGYARSCQLARQTPANAGRRLTRPVGTAPPRGARRQVRLP
ncbi:MAG TPA: hypothetical protein DCM14_00625, partial [Clostridiales bacterium UBA8153]|nr:hypothetical protein [Clostridiales bacterium UBA8153]